MKSTHRNLPTPIRRTRLQLLDGNMLFQIRTGVGILEENRSYVLWKWHNFFPFKISYIGINCVLHGIPNGLPTSYYALMPSWYRTVTSNIPFVPWFKGFDIPWELIKDFSRLRLEHRQIPSFLKLLSPLSPIHV